MRGHARDSSAVVNTTTIHTKTWRYLLFPILITLLSTLPAAPALAAAYPEHPIRLIIPFPPGGPNDILSRLISAEMSKDLKGSVVVENKGGAGGTIGANDVAMAPPDGYTLLLGGTATMSIAPYLYAKLPYNVINSFTPIGMIGTSPSVLVVAAKEPFHTVQDIIAAAKAKPGTLNFASAGVGTPPHLAGELFASMAGVNIVHVPYKGGGPAMDDVLAGRTEMYFAGITSVLPLVRQGSLRAIAVTSLKRNALIPNVPTVAESGLPGYEIQNWYAIYAPAGTPAAIVKRLNQSLARVLTHPSVAKKMREDLMINPDPTSPDQLLAYQKQEVQKWEKLSKQIGLKPE